MSLPFVPHKAYSISAFGPHNRVEFVSVRVDERACVSGGSCNARAREINEMPIKFEARIRVRLAQSYTPRWLGRHGWIFARLYSHTDRYGTRHFASIVFIIIIII